MTPPGRHPPGLFFNGSLSAAGKPILGPIRLQAEAAGWTCLLGPSGVGKSSILHLLAGVADGLELAGQAGASDGQPLAGRVALMAQSDLLLPWLTLAQNVALGARLRGETAEAGRAIQMLAAVGLGGFEGRKPHGLSGGQRQRAALARTLYEDRPVVLLDEPFSALDVANRARMQDLAARALTGRTVLQVTHDPAEAARLGARILVLGAAGLSEVAAPQGPAPRPPDAPEVLAATGRLTRMLLEAAR